MKAPIKKNSQVRFLVNPHSYFIEGGGEYQVTQFKGTNQIISRNFPELNLTAQQIFDAAL